MKRAVLVGINYQNSKNQLKGCINDVLSMEPILRTQFGFSEIIVLTEKQATSKAIKQALSDTVAASKNGDLIFFQYSGHGAQLKDRKDSGDNESDGYDEVLVPYDNNWKDRCIRDDDLRHIFGKVANCVEVIALIDCCHSATVMDGSINGYSDGLRRYISVPNQILSESAKLSTKVEQSLDMIGVTLTGCRDNQVSADATFNGVAMGACTHYVQRVLGQNNYTVTYKQLEDLVGGQLARNKFAQQPQLSGDFTRFDKPFLGGRISNAIDIAPFVPSTPSKKSFFRSLFK